MTGEINCRVCGSTHLPGACPRLRRITTAMRAVGPVGALPVEARITRETPIISDTVDSRPQAIAAVNVTVQSFDLAPGSTVGEYQIIRKIGGGAMGEVYRAVHPLIERSIAIKVLSGSHLGSQSATARLIQEGHASNRMRHRNIVDV